MPVVRSLGIDPISISISDDEHGIRILDAFLGDACLNILLDARKCSAAKPIQLLADEVGFIHSRVKAEQPNIELRAGIQTLSSSKEPVHEPSTATTGILEHPHLNTLLDLHGVFVIAG